MMIEEMFSSLLEVLGIQNTEVS